MRAPHLRTAALAAIAVAVVAGFGSASASATPSHAQIQGSGSSWSSNAINQWVADVQQNGLQVVFTANGSAQGRQDFANLTTDFAVSDIGYQGQDAQTGQDDTSKGRAFAYLPVVAGGTSFPYHLTVGGKLVRNLRLSGLTLTKIFTGAITNWDDPAVTKDNNGRALPSIPVVVVTHSEGSGSTAQFTKYMQTEYPSQWHAGFTEYWPSTGTGKHIAQNGSDGVMNFIASKAANGAIGYDEYSYALSSGYPVVKVENSSGYFTAPDQYNVAVALTQALINNNKSSPNYLLQDLHKVYTYSDKRTYPLSSYSYMIIPTGGGQSSITTPKRQTLADFLYYSICQGQAEMGPIGYSPLPVNLVQASFQQTAKLKAADSGVVLNNESIATCHNPTFVAGHPTENYLAKIAPQPPLCDKTGQGPCADSNAGITVANPTGGKAPASAPGSTSPASAGGTGGGTGGSGTGSGSNASTSGTGSGTGGTVAGGTLAGGSAGGDPNAVGSPVLVSDAASTSTNTTLAALAALALVALLVVPPLVYVRLGRRRPGGTPAGARP